jgi:hypothetical protein
MTADTYRRWRGSTPLAAAQLTGGSHPAEGHSPVLLADPRVRAYLAQSLAVLNEGAGSSRRVERLMLFSDPPQLDASEITDKGYINQRACLTRRAADGCCAPITATRWP